MLGPTRFIEGKQRRIIFGNDPLHPVGQNLLRVGQVQHDLLDRPGAGNRKGHEIIGLKSLDRLGDMPAAVFIRVDKGSIHGQSLQETAPLKSDAANYSSQSADRSPALRYNTRGLETGRLTQRLEYVVYTDGVGGSNPSSPISLPCSRSTNLIAQNRSGCLAMAAFGSV